LSICLARSNNLITIDFQTVIKHGPRPYLIDSIEYQPWSNMVSDHVWSTHAFYKLSYFRWL